MFIVGAMLTLYRELEDMASATTMLLPVIFVFNFVIVGNGFIQSA